MSKPKAAKAKAEKHPGGRPSIGRTTFAKWMASKGVSALDIASKTGLGRETVGRWRRGTAAASTATYALLRQHFPDAPRP